MFKFRKALKSNDGFSLAELIIVVVIIGIVVGGSIIVGYNSVRSNARRAMAEKLSYSLQTLQVQTKASANQLYGKIYVKDDKYVFETVQIKSDGTEEVINTDILGNKEYMIDYNTEENPDTFKEITETHSKSIMFNKYNGLVTIETYSPIIRISKNTANHIKLAKETGRVIVHTD